MITHWFSSIVFVVQSLCAVSSVSAFVSDDPSHHRTAESFQKSGYYDFLWPLIQEEFDNAADQEEYSRLIDIVIRTGSVYAQPFQNSSDGLTDLYPELLMLDADPPLYVQYRYESSQSQFGFDSPDDDYFEHALSLVKITQRMGEADYPPYVVGATWVRAAEFFRNAGKQGAKSTRIPIYS